MTERIISEMTKWFEEKISECERRKNELSGDCREDEAVFEKIKANVYDIFKTMLDVGAKISGGDEEKLKAFFISKTKTIPQNWFVSLENAQKHGDEEKAQTEIVKIEALEEIIAQFKSTAEGTI